MKILHTVAFGLLVIGGLNWLLTAFNYNLVAMLTDPLPMIIYVLVGLSAIAEVATHGKNCRQCSSEMPMNNAPRV